jgi:hypothetical protein
MKMNEKMLVDNAHCNKTGARKLIKGTSSTFPLSLPIAKERTNKIAGK